MSDKLQKMAKLLMNDNSNVFKAIAKPRKSTIDAQWIGDKLIAKDGTIVMQSPSIGQAAQAINSFMPITGDIQSGIMAANDVKNGDYKSAALNGIGLLPFVPSMAGIISKSGKIADILGDTARAKTKYELAHELAQKNAIEMLGLPRNNTAMDRAKALGFDTDNVVYHGTDSEIKSIKPSMLGSATKSESARKAFWAASDPTTAEGYANHSALDAKVQALIDKSDMYERKGMHRLSEKAIIDAEKLENANNLNPNNGQNILPLLVQKNKQENINADGNSFMDIQDEMHNALNSAIKNKSSSVKVDNLSDEIGYGNYNPVTHYGILNTNAIRSPFAAFDPANAHKADILGQADPKFLALLGGTSALGINYLRNNKK
jgi:hypothetical protein